MNRFKAIRKSKLNIIALLIILCFTLLTGTVLSSTRYSWNTSTCNGSAPAAMDYDSSVTCVPLGLNGTITSDVLTEKLTDGGAETAFIGTSTGLFVITEGELLQFVYSPFGVSHIAVIEDITGDNVREVVISLASSDVPSIQCYNGATWKKIWHYSPKQKVFVDSMGWAELQFRTVDLDIADAGNFQAILVTADRCLFSIDGRNGNELWKFQAADDKLSQMAVISDIDSDNYTEVAVGSKEGYVYLLSGKTGKIQWQKRVAQEYTVYNGYSTETVQPAVNDIATFDKNEAKIVTSSGEGIIRLIDLRDRRSDWEVAIVDDLPSNLYVSVVDDVTGDTQPEIIIAQSSNNYRDFPVPILNEGNEIDSPGIFMENEIDMTGIVMGNEREPGKYPSNDASDREVVVLDGADGEELWKNDLTLWPNTGVQSAYFDDELVILEPSSQRVNLIDMATGEPLPQSIDIATSDEAAFLAAGFTENEYLLVSHSSDLAIVSASKDTLGDIMWNYPRVDASSVKKADFTGDQITDILVCGNKGMYVRLFCVVDGTSGNEVWRYEVPYSTVASSDILANIEVVPDLDHDGIQDVIGYRGSNVVIFSGSDGAISEFSTENEAMIVALNTIKNDDGNVIVVGNNTGLAILDSHGETLWSGLYQEWGEAVYGQGQFRVLDDINNDGVSDLAIILTSDIVILNSDVEGNSLEFKEHLSMKAIVGSSVQFESIAPDVDDDGVGEVVMFGHHSEGYRKLFMVTPTSGNVLLELTQDRQIGFNWACADFNTDGFKDSIVYWTSDMFHHEYRYYENPKLEVLSGKDGESLWSYSFSQSGGNYGMPALVIGDISGDGVNELAFAIEYPEQTTIVVYDVVENKMLSEIVLPSLRSVYQTREVIFGTGGVSETSLEAAAIGNSIRICNDLNNDGYSELAYVYNQRVGTSEAVNSIALIDPVNKELLACFVIAGSSLSKLFDTDQSSILGVASCGGYCLLDMGNAIQMTAPGDGDMLSSPVTVAWQGSSSGDFSEVFVDGVRNKMTNDSEVELPIHHGKHDLLVRSINENGKISYVTATVEIEQPFARYIVVCVTALVLVGLFGLMLYCRIARLRRKRNRIALS